MFTEFVARHMPLIVAAIALLPVLVFVIALFVEGARRPRWNIAGGRLTRRATPEAQQRATPEAQQRATPETRTRLMAHSASRRGPVTAGGLGIRHGVAAPRDHD